MAGKKDKRGKLPPAASDPKVQMLATNPSVVLQFMSTINGCADYEACQKTIIAMYQAAFPEGACWHAQAAMASIIQAQVLLQCESQDVPDMAKAIMNNAFHLVAQTQLAQATPAGRA